MLGIAVMLNNFFHDLMVGLLIATLLLTLILRRELDRNPSLDPATFAGLYRWLSRLAGFAFIFILLGGAVRALTYREFEWSDAAGRGQVPALMAKHALLAFFIVLGLWGHLRMRSRMRREGKYREGDKA